MKALRALFGRGKGIPSSGVRVFSNPNSRGHQPGSEHHLQGWETISDQGDWAPLGEVRAYPVSNWHCEECEYRVELCDVKGHIVPGGTIYGRAAFQTADSVILTRAYGRDPEGRRISLGGNPPSVTLNRGQVPGIILSRCCLKKRDPLRALMEHLLRQQFPGGRVTDPPIPGDPGKAGAAYRSAADEWEVMRENLIGTFRAMVVQPGRVKVAGDLRTLSEHLAASEEWSLSEVLEDLMRQGLHPSSPAGEVPWIEVKEHLEREYRDHFRAGDLRESLWDLLRELVLGTALKPFPRDQAILRDGGQVCPAALRDHTSRKASLDVHAIRAGSHGGLEGVVTRSMGTTREGKAWCSYKLVAKFDGLQRAPAKGGVNVEVVAPWCYSPEGPSDVDFLGGRFFIVCVNPKLP